MAADPIKDVRTSTCGPEVGYAGCTFPIDGPDEPADTYWFKTRAADTSRAMREAGAWFQRMWDAGDWFARRLPAEEFRAKWGIDDETWAKKYRRYDRSDPDAAFAFWKANGFKVLFTLEAWRGERSKREIVELVDYIAANHYEDVVAGFELGNETYYSKDYASLAPVWQEIIPEIRRRMPKVNLGINLAELFELNPDIEQVRNRMLAAGEIQRDTYFAAADFNRYTAQFVAAMSNSLDQITHVIYHAYGAETPYSCSYHGIQRFRNYVEAFPELKGKQWWLTEIRPRSDEDNQCQRQFREALVMGHYALSMIMQPEVDGYNHHQILAISGVKLNLSEMNLTYNGDTGVLTATVEPETATDQTVTWSSDNVSVATVSAEGIVTPVGAGEATITVKSDNNITKKYVITVEGDGGVSHLTAKPSAPVIILGDADGNGTVESADSAMLMRRIVYIETPCDDVTLSRGNVNDDLFIDVMDVTYIQRYLALINVEYPINQYVPVK